MRRLLPYEHQLVEALGISKKEYLEFVAVQQEYKDSKVGTALDVRCSEPGTVALVLTIIGILFQVGAALLTPKPEIPGASGRRRQRQQRFAPTFGFNSTQELALYGDTINLVYTNTDQNSNGGVRVSGSLVWSAVDNFGASQFMQLLIVLGASNIQEIDETKTAFGQLALSSLNPGLVWLFYKNKSGDEGNLTYKDLELGDLDLLPGPLRGLPSSTNVCSVGDHKQDGYSQAYSPTTAISFGVYDPIPVNVDVLTRNRKGQKRDAPLNVKLTTNEWIAGSGNIYREGHTIELEFAGSSNKDGDKEATEIARDTRRQAAEALSFGATYMLGAAKFKLIGFTRNSTQDIDEGTVIAEFKCIKSGSRPSAAYSTKRPRTEDEDFRKELENAERILSNRNDSNEEIVETAVDVNWSGRGSVRYETYNPPEKDEDEDELLSDAFSVTYPNENYSFTGNITVKWADEYGASHTYLIEKAGSIEYTKQLRADFLAEKPTLDVAKVTNDLQTQLDVANNEIDGILTGEYDSVKDLKTDIKNLIKFDREVSYDKKENIGIINKLNNEIEGLKKQISALELKKQLPFKERALKNSAFNGDNGGTKAQRTPLGKDTDIKLKKEIAKFENQLDELREDREARRVELIAKARNKYVKQLRTSKDAFTSKLTGNKYSNGGVRAMERKLKALPTTGKITDKKGVEKIKAGFKSLLDEKREVLKLVKETLEVFDDKYVTQLDNNFFVKCLVKSESASYQTVSKCDIVKFSIKSSLFRRISGRQKKYGEKNAPEGHKHGDNGVKGRMAFFRVSYKKDRLENYEEVPLIFVLRHGTESDVYSQLNFHAKDRERYSFKFEPIYDVAAHDIGRFAFIENSPRTSEYTFQGNTFSWSGRTIPGTNRWGFPNLEERGPRYTNEWDMFSVNTDTQVQFSFENGPELSISAVTEQQQENTSDKYKNLSMLSVNISAGQGVQDLRDTTVFVTKGKHSFTVEDINTDNPTPSSKSTSFAPDIFTDTVLDKENGVRKYIPVSALDKDSLKLAKNFCKENNLPAYDDNGLRISPINLHMDGIIADASAWRSFWTDNAPFSLLELARKNGADTLIPAVPVNRGGRAAESDGRPVPVTISALFTPGNILEDSFKEEFLNYGPGTQELIASVIYRDTTSGDVFSSNKSVEIRRAGVQDVSAVRQTFDASQFVTQRQQAIMFGKLLVNQRYYVSKGIEFRTFPSEAAIEPGAFIYVDVGLKDWDRYSTGMVMSGGELNSPIKDQITNGTYSFLFYNAETGVADTEAGTYEVLNNVVSNLPKKYEGQMFVLGVEKPSKRVYRVTEVAIEEEGEVMVKALEYPCFTEGDDEPRARIADFRASKFDIQ
jgi:hypothetical protein